MTISKDAAVLRPQVLRQIAELQRLATPELMERWRVLMGTEPPPYNKQFLLKRLIYRVQELAYGGLPMSTYQEMDRVLTEAGYDELAATVTPGHAKKPAPHRKPGIPVVGTQLLRVWNGGRYEVLVTRDGFEFEGRPYKSLTAITKVITGTHWNGPKFFGLRVPKDGEDV
jgi:hypothetical protein